MPIIGALIGGGASLIGGLMSSGSAEDAARVAQGYQGQYLSDADKLAWQLMQQQAAYQPDWTNTTNATNQMLANYMGLTGQSYNSPGTTQQVLNPAYTSYMAGQGGGVQGGQPSNYDVLSRLGIYPSGGNLRLIGGLFNNFQGGALGRLLTGQGQTQAPSQYITQAVPGEAVPYSGVNYLDYLNQYLTGAFTPESDEIYNLYLNRAVQGTRGGLTARGLNTSPYGAGIEGETSGEFALQWALEEESRRSAALQNYMAGQGSLQSLGQGALEQALALEQLKQGWSQPSITNALNYMGKASNNSGNATAAQILANSGQQQANQWAQLGQSAGTALSNINWGGSSPPIDMSDWDYNMQLYGG